MAPEVFVAVIALMGTLGGSFLGVLASTKLTNHRLKELEKKVEKHNNLIERTAVVERDLKTAFRYIDELNEWRFEK
ncbi:MAG: hypothetical protein Q4B48_04055 [Syntrophomonadaceae bacterium]|nr:hypothetical protein [Syntrophomonadaceae bacterium]